ncbi:MAG TPA: DUF72 domain-containing protein [Acidimicrobiales bacterium]|jgi:uncharacterized protein YecE (DUF72 family)|nr:DUF72 domain-containing protein [Acidimicrobiales bacterium]
MTLLIGTSGWHYADWKGRFYPAELRSGDWLAYYSQGFATVELNNAFYRLPDAEQFAEWAAAVPDDFVVAVKASRYLTHVKRLNDPAEPVSRLVRAAEGLGAKLGVYLLQLPPNLAFDADRLDRALKAFPRGARVAVEGRHPSWQGDGAEVRRILERRSAAWVIADPSPIGPADWRTTDWGYVRFHRGHAQPAPCYSRAALETRAGRIAALWADADDVFCYFNNDTNGCAPRDARWFAAAGRRAGRSPTRVPGPRQTPLRERRRTA